MAGGKAQNEVRVFRREESGRLDTLLNSLTIDQINSAGLRLCGDSFKTARNRDDAIEELLSSGRSKQAVIEQLLDIEAETPQKHCFFAYWNGNPPLHLNYGLLKSTSAPGFVFRFTHTHDGADYRVFTFEHSINCHRWVLQPDRKTKRLEKFKIRHPVVVRLYLDRPFLLIQYPGFTQHADMKREKTLDYQGIVSELLDVLKNVFSVSATPMPFREVINLLHKGESNRLRFVHVSPATSTGRMSVSTGSENLSVTEWIAKFLEPHLPGTNKEELIAGVSQAVRSSSLSSIVAFWLREKVFTRIQFWNTGTELLFIWKGIHPTFYVIETILGLAYRLSSQVSDGTKSEILEFIVSKKDDYLFQPGELCNKYGKQPELVQGILLEAVQAGFIVPAYRLKTERLLLESSNPWTKSLPSLRRVFHTEDGKDIDGSDPANIEVGFFPTGKATEAGIA